jgi:small subunit ribosomal protein S6
MAKMYETVVIVDAMIPDEAIQSEFDAIQKKIEENGTLLKLDRWGKRRLAYDIGKRSHGDYCVFYYESKAEIPTELEKNFRINENVLRWLTIADNPCGIPAERKIDSDNIPLPMTDDAKGDD